MLTAFDDEMNDIGVFTRSYIHYHGLWHKVAQCWIAYRAENGIRIYLQRRSFEKKSHPGRYDITAAGHVSAGETPEMAMLREMMEETGLSIDLGRVHKLGYVKEEICNDREIAYLYVYVEKDPPFRPGREVIYMVSVDIDDFYGLLTGQKDEIMVVPAIKTGPMIDEAFSIRLENCSVHQNFVDIVYPYIKKLLG